MEPIVVEFDVNTSVAHAFDVWTSKTAMWWPRAHTMSRDSDLAVVFEPFVGGRIYERASDGLEHAWGEVLVWDPPEHIVYLWHLFFDRSEATEVSVTFKEKNTGSRVRIEQSGFEILGEPAGTERRNETDRAWLEVVGYYQEMF